MGRTWTWGVWLGLLALGCGGAPDPQPAPTPPVLDTPATPPQQQPEEPRHEEPKPEPLHCPGDAALVPEPASADPGACRETVQEGDGRTRTRTERRFDAAGRLLSRETYGPEGSLGAFERRSYDAAGRLLSLETPAAHSTWSLDPCGRPLVLETRESSGSTLRTTFSYDEVGRLLDTSRTYAGSTQDPRTERVHLEYDAEGRLQRQEQHTERGGLVSRQVDAYRYDAQGRITWQQTTRDGAGYDAPQERWTETAYDAAGRAVLARTQPEQGPLQRTEWLYDAAGRLRMVEHTEERSSSQSPPPQGMPLGTRERRSYDAQGRPTLVVTEEFGEDYVAPETTWSCTYQEDGGRTERYHERRLDVDRWERTYDARGLLLSWKTENFDWASFSNGTLTYGAAGELLRSETRRTTSGHHWSYVEVHAYDASGRLASTDSQSIAEGGMGVTYSHTERVLGYDAAGHVTLQEDWDLAGPARVLLLRLQNDYVCMP